jgi:microcompartment protein CcmK/EutM
VVLDRLGARRGTTVLVSTDGDAVRRLQGNTVPARLSVVGIVDEAVGPASGR